LASASEVQAASWPVAKELHDEWHIKRTEGPLKRAPPLVADERLGHALTAITMFVRGHDARAAGKVERRLLR